MHEGIRPDMVIVGKALSGGFYPVSAVLLPKRYLVFSILATMAAPSAAIRWAARRARGATGAVDEKLIQRSAELGEYFLQKLQTIAQPASPRSSRQGLWIAIELDVPARPYCEALKERKVFLQRNARVT